jgi:hypothetical protein
MIEALNKIAISFEAEQIGKADNRGRRTLAFLASSLMVI